ncbi:MAG: hypothetical protein EAZ60_06890 [Oscillatoriales cyanobacterium]|nr:MAG: hypothetical protein EAZ83_13035 [Oscillatoriales cyanobacterium]TAE97071.1 MAG: hypothetical protein EAZ79_12275 [Oscillatoriales cyanobacterium]TAF20616.1 MAG: hypothetical protein EAZ73_11655 [Oscillatoriales cyanobacterium]TAF35907.1 MAG: hypothetical protein EAZ69_11820 [Oscillatoriales cyanobacterium]TAF57446.1 MAG: hypothetical protein EAZ60_06890 [Oscillatoriales cyanobacterium]
MESLTIIAFEVGLCSILAILGVARNRVFSQNIDTPPKSCEKPGFLSYMRGQKPGFFREYRSTTEKLRKTRFL